MTRRSPALGRGGAHLVLHPALHGGQVHGRAAEHVLGEQQRRAARAQQRLRHARMPAQHRVVQRGAQLRV